MRNLTPKEKINFVKARGTITLVDNEWVFKGDPTKDGNVETMKHWSRICLIELVYDILRDVKL